MNSIELTDGDVRYVIRFVPLAEARELQRAGTKMYDYSALTAIDTCPTYGVLRYGLHRTDIPLTTGGRSMAIEAGKACHDYYAALRMWTIAGNQVGLDNGTWHTRWLQHGEKLFGPARWNSILQQPQDTGNPVNNATLFALEALHTSGFYDDPDDKRRTMQNLEVACMAYTDRYFQSDMPVLVRDDFIGVECPFVLEVMRCFEDFNGEGWIPEQIAYYCGRIDGVQTWGDKLVVCENKSASRIGDAWRTSFAISHQVTGYTIAGSCMLGELVDTAFVMGMQIPPTRDIYSGVAFEILSRTDSDRLRWCEWFFDGVSKYERHSARPTYAPRYSHSCNRYFSACQFIPYCASAREEQAELIEGMRTDEWSPLDHLDSGHATVEE